MPWARLSVTLVALVVEADSSHIYIYIYISIYIYIYIYYILYKRIVLSALFSQVWLRRSLGLKGLCQCRQLSCSQAWHLLVRRRRTQSAGKVA